MATSANAERREATRRRFNGTVELALPDEAEGYEADAVDLSIGGMALKTAFLPDVGSEMDCRFVLDSAEPRTVQARGKVVWARDEGSDAGSFGLRFTELSSGDRAALERHCDPHGAKSDDRVRLRLPKMGEPLKARLKHEAEGAVVVGMDLSFINVGESIEVESARGKKRGKLEDVAVDIDPSTRHARLLLTVSLDGSNSTGRHAAVVLPSPQRGGLGPTHEPSRAARIEAPVAVAPCSASSSDADRTDESDARAELEQAETLAQPRPSSATPSKKTAAGTGTEVLSSRDGVERASSIGATESSASSLASRSSAPAWLVSALSRTRAQCSALWQKAGPTLTTWVATIAAALRSLVARAQGKISGKLAPAEDAAKSDRVTARAPASAPRPALRKQKRELEPSRAGESAAITSTEPSVRRKYALVGLGAFGLSAIVFALATGGREPRARTPRPQVAVDPSPSNGGATASSAAPAVTAEGASTEAASSATAPANEPETSGPNRPGESSASTAAGEPSPGARRMPTDLVAAARSRNANVDQEPPIVRRGAQNVLGPAPSVATAAARHEVASSARPLGSPAVQAGTVIRLRVDGPITRLSGGAAGADSLTFRVPGRRALDRAAGFVRMDARLAGAGAFNRGGNTEFTLRFHGAAPPFSARARGDVLEVILAAPTHAAAPAHGAAARGGSPIRVAAMPRPRR